jgi:hypothetical protein
VFDAVLPESRQVYTEGVGFHAIGARFEVRLVHAADDIRPGDAEHLVAALEPFEVVQREVGGLQHRAHRPIGDEHPVG